MTGYNFDDVIDRRAVPALKHHRIVLSADGMDLFPAGVADMDFRVAPCIAQRASHGVFGYEIVPDGLSPEHAANAVTCLSSAKSFNIACSRTRLSNALAALQRAIHEYRQETP